MIFATGCGGGRSETNARQAFPAAPVTVQTVQSETVPVFEEVVGTVRPRQEAQVSAKVSGRVLSIEAVPGKRVKAGETLARIDAEELNASRERAKAALEQAERDLERFEKLKQSGAATQSELEQAEARQRMAAATLKEAETVADNTAVTAPFDGVVTRKLMEPGDFAAPGRPLFSMEDSSLLRLQIAVAESLAGEIKIGDAFRVRVEGAGGADVEGRVSEVAPSADVGSRTFSIKLDLPANEALRAGQFGRAFLPRGDRRALRVPESAVIARGQMDYVFVAADDGVARLRIVRTGEARDGAVEILAGLDGGEAVVTDPPAELRDGQPLSIK
ncbi:MAG: efflux RND transporter periplasmic adaptor subunit [Verrucomicrobiae bacterium]|nr:efflux RND transporter periplasmic adaptor subunit [Verrucomicrobiae bacterium]